MGSSSGSHQPIGTTVPRVDAAEKITGSARYLADIPIPGALRARLLVSDRPHARFTLRLPTDLETGRQTAGTTLVTASDIPGENGVHVIDDTWPLLAENEVTFVGESIAIALGPTATAARALADAVTVEYEDLPAIFGVDDARANGSSFDAYRLCYPGEDAVDRDRDTQDYDTRDHATRGRDDSGAPPEASRFVKLAERFETGPQEHVYMEPQGMTAEYTDGKLTVRGSMQCPYYVKRALEVITGLDPRAVRVIQTTTGGGFGGKEDYPSVLAGLVAVAAMKTGAPVVMILDRDQDIQITTKRHPSRFDFDSTVSVPGGAADHTGASATSEPRPCWSSSEVEIALDGGAWVGLSAVVLQRAIFAATGVYRPPVMKASGTVWRTNVVPYGAFRGFGAPQAVFAVEMHMHHLARELGEDPVDFKRRHLVKRGDTTITGGTFRGAVVLPEMIDRVLDISEYRRKYREYDIPRGTRRERRGRQNQRVAERCRRGIGLSIFNHGCGFTGSGEQDIIKAVVRLERDDEGIITIGAANVEMGQGALTTLRKLTARALGIPIDRVRYGNPDTDLVPDSGPTVASRTSMIVGGLLHRAALRLREMAGPVSVEEHYRAPDQLHWDQARFRGDAYPAFSWGVNVAEIELDLLTYDITPIAIYGVYDIGELLDEQIVIGQMHGGIVQGLGWAISEKLELREGRFLQSTMTDYAIPGSRDVPAITVDFVSNPSPFGPYGAKGAGELPFNGPAPAIAAAVEQALGRPVYRIPLTPEYLAEVDR